jgi:hypothetical protein
MFTLPTHFEKKTSEIDKKERKTRKEIVKKGLKCKTNKD